jgi:hypothetical protein
MRSHSFLVIALACLAGSTLAQSAAYTHFGTDCSSTTWRPVTFRALGVPRIGTTFHVETESSSGGVGGSTTTFLFTGVSRTSYGGLRLPFDVTTLRTIGRDFCGLLYVSIDVNQQMPYRGVQPQLVQVPFQVPNDPALVGQRLYQQVLQVVSIPHEIDYYLSRAGEALLGT